MAVGWLAMEAVLWEEWALLILAKMEFESLALEEEQLDEGGKVALGCVGNEGNGGNVVLGCVGNEGNGGNVVLGRVGTEGNGGNVVFGRDGMVGTGSAGGGAAGVSKRWRAAWLIWTLESDSIATENRRKKILWKAMVELVTKSSNYKICTEV
ncbi:hypothetical protein DVH24_014439 [Malus domestica]|uniref:Uncharacterized protein n=1 Tax=Malus domestica TaxID=3750 RepID=A0A498KS57_MALDO|nr:hypothetical protein DVH24_014439 [Malus domestica]